MARFTLAVDRPKRKDADANTQTADFPSIVAMGRSAEIIEQYLHQGTKIAVTGRIQTGSYTNRDGQKVYTTDVLLQQWEFCESKGASGSGQEQKATAQPTQPTQARPQQQSMATAAAQGVMDIPNGLDDEELPFN